MKIWILFLQWSKCIPVNLRGTLETFDGKFDGFHVPHSSKMWRNKHFWPKTATWDLQWDHGVCRSHPILFKRYNISFKFDVNAFWPWQEQNSDFQFLTFPIGYVGVWGDGGVWRPTLNFLKGIFVQEGSSGTRFDHGQYEIKTFPICVPP